MKRLTTIITALAILCPTLVSAADAPNSLVARLAALTSGSQSQTLKMTPRPKMKTADGDDPFICAERGSGCGPGYPKDCCDGCYIPPGNTHGECQ